jgi:hypothetical protein
MEGNGRSNDHYEYTSTHLTGYRSAAPVHIHNYEYCTPFPQLTSLNELSKTCKLLIMLSNGDSEYAAPVAVETNKMVDLTEKLDKIECYARNESSQYPWTNLLIGDTRLGCKSDADEQLIIHVAFNEFVKVSRLEYGNKATVRVACKY